MKKVKLLLPVGLLVCLILSASICNGAAITPNWVAYDYKTTVEPPTNFVDGTSAAPMAKFCVIDNGALVLNSMSDPSAGPTYKLMISTPPAVGYKFTAVIRAKVDAGLDIDFRATLRERIFLSGSGIEFKNTGKTETSVKTSDWHTYFLSYEIISDAGTPKLVTKLYVDGASTPLMEGLSTSTDSSNYFRFGDGSSSNGYSASIDWIIWTFDGAFSPDQVNLPAGFALK